MAWRKVTISTFLNERKGRYKPDEAMRMKLKRIDKIDFSNNIHLNETTETKTDMILVKQGDLVISGINAEKGAIAIYRGQEDIMATIHYSSYTYNEKEIDIDYLKWFLKSETFLSTLKEQTKGGIKTELKPNRLLPLEIYLPDKPTQKQILKKLNNIEEEVLELEENIDDTADLLKKLRQSILQDAVKGKLVPQNPKDEPASELLKRNKAEKEKLIKQGKIKKEKPLPLINESEIPYDLPNGWAWCRLGEIADIGTGATPLTSKKEYYLNGTIPWITSSATALPFIDFAETFITQKAIDETNCKVYPKGTLVIAMYGQGKTRGQITELNLEAATNQACATMSFYIPDLALRRFVKIFFQKFYNELREDATGSAQPNLNMIKIRTSIIPIPPLTEQSRIVEKVNQLMALCASLEKEIAHSKLEADYLLNAILRETFQHKQKEYSKNEFPISMAAEQ
ncbi:MAG: restriction endonuclease subunit S [Verrucomicrobia bacterium]|nr:restriction endonuclease subunit S [Verrucomicrobiota bacterium]